MVKLKTFKLPQTINGGDADRTLAEEMIAAWRKDGIFQVAINRNQQPTVMRAFLASQRFFSLPYEKKSTCISESSYSGYIASREEVTAGERDYSEIFTVCKDLPPDHPSVKQQRPCHGPVPWPDAFYKKSMTDHMRMVGRVGDKLLKLVSLGLGFGDGDALVKITRRGWHHMRVLRFPTCESGSTRGIGAHTDYGLLVIAAQDDVGGLYIRPPVAGEVRHRNWLPSESSAGMYEHREPWHYVTPVPNVLTVFPGDIMQFITDGYLLSTPHKVKLNTRERFALAYFHEPDFDACIHPKCDTQRREFIHYGRHFTNMFMRSYPNRVTTRRLIEKYPTLDPAQAAHRGGTGSF